MEHTFIVLPERFSYRGKVNSIAIESYRKDEVQARSGRYRIVIELASNKALTAEFEDEAMRDKIFLLLDRHLTGKDKIPQYDALDER